jgi:hypothetical protein
MSKTVQITKSDFNKIKKALDRSYNGLDEYARTLRDTWVCYRHLDAIYEILEKYEEK